METTPAITIPRPVIRLIPMLCSSGNHTSVPVGARRVADGKGDGWRMLIERRKDSVHVVCGRSEADYTGRLPYLEEALMALPVGTILDGEIMGDGGWGDVQSVMSTECPHNPDAFDARFPALTFMAFDILAVGTTDDDGSVTVHDLRKRPWTDRREILTSVEGIPHVALSPIYECSEAGLKQALADGLEGFVVKDMDAPYISGRSPGWKRVKMHGTNEAVVIGFKDGAGNKAGQVGAFELEMLDENGVPNGVRTRAKCGNDTIHASATRDRDARARGELPAKADRWLGAVVEVSHNGLWPNGVPRHPQIVRRRDDRIVGTTPVGFEAAPVTDPTPVAAAAKAKPQATAKARPPRRPANGGSGRNYKSMGDAKIGACVEELRAREGDAYDRVDAKCDTDAQRDVMVAADLATATSVARDREDLAYLFAA